MIPSPSPYEKIQIMGANIAVAVRKKEKKDGSHFFVSRPRFEFSQKVRVTRSNPGNLLKEIGLYPSTEMFKIVIS